MITVKQGDRYGVPFTAVDMDLTSCEVRLLARRIGSGETLVLDHEVTDGAGGTVTHRLDGSLTVGDYHVELEVTPPDGDVVTFPTRQGDEPQYLLLRVLRDLG